MQLIIIAFAATAICLPLAFRISNNWIIADKSIKNILTAIANESSKCDTLLLADIPQQYEGSFIFRNGFYEALELGGINTSNIIVINYLTKKDLNGHPGIIKPLISGETVYLYPRITIEKNILQYKTIDSLQQSKNITISKGSHFLYWNNEMIKRLF